MQVMFLVIFLCLVQLFLAAAGQGEGGQPEPAAESEVDLELFRSQLTTELSRLSWKTSVKVGYLSFDSPNSDDPVLSYLSRFIPRSLLGQVSVAGDRQLDEDERTLALNRAADRVRGTAMQALSTYENQAARAVLLRQNLPTPGTRRQLVSQADSLLGLGRPETLGSDFLLPQEWIAYLPEKLAMSPVYTDNPAPFPGNAAELFPIEETTPSALRSLGRAAREAEVQYLVVGRIEPIGADEAYLSVEYAVYSELGNRFVASGSFVSAASAAGDAAVAEAQRLARILKNGNSGSLQAFSYPPIYELALDGDSLGWGSAAMPYVSSGEHELELRYSSRRSIGQTVRLEDAESTVVHFPAAPPLYSFVAVSSTPPGARVYVDGVYAGESPVTIAASSNTRVLEFSKEGYHSRRVVLSPEQRRTGVHVPLLDNRVDWGRRVQLSRDRFYGALGLTVLTAAIPIVLSGLYADSATLVRAGNLNNSELLNQANGLYWARNGGLILTGATLILTFTQLDQYTQAARAALTF